MGDWTSKERGYDSINQPTKYISEIIHIGYCWITKFNLCCISPGTDINKPVFMTDPDTFFMLLFKWFEAFCAPGSSPFSFGRCKWPIFVFNSSVSKQQCGRRLFLLFMILLMLLLLLMLLIFMMLVMLLTLLLFMMLLLLLPLFAFTTVSVLLYPFHIVFHPHIEP